MTALLAVQQQLMTDLMERELAYFRDLENDPRHIQLGLGRPDQRPEPWQERMAEIAEGAARFLAQVTPGAVAGADRQNRRVAAQAAAIISNSPNHLDRVAARR